MTCTFENKLKWQIGNDTKMIKKIVSGLWKVLVNYTDLLKKDKITKYNARGGKNVVSLKKASFKKL